MKVIKIITKSVTYEAGDFYGGDGENDVIKRMDIEDFKLIITTSSTDYEVPIQDGDWAKFEDGTDMTFDFSEEDDQ